MKPILSTTDEVKLAVIRDMGNSESSPDQYQFTTSELHQLTLKDSHWEENLINSYRISLNH